MSCQAASCTCQKQVAKAKDFCKACLRSNAVFKLLNEHGRTVDCELSSAAIAVSNVKCLRTWRAGTSVLASSLKSLDMAEVNAEALQSRIAELEDELDRSKAEVCWSSLLHSPRLAGAIVIDGCLVGT